MAGGAFPDWMVIRLISDSGGLLFFHTNQRRTANTSYERSFDAENQPYRGFRTYSFSEPPNGYPYMRNYPGWGKMGFGLFAGAPADPDPGLAYSDQFIVVPFWFVILLFAALPSRWILIPRRRKGGLCEKCGYDMRATPTRCPECGCVPAGGTRAT
jgi:hypothetical protein